MKTAGIVLLIIGLLMTIITGFTVITKEEVADIGPVEINKTEKHPIYWSPVTGIVLAAAGFILLVADRRRSAKT